MGVWGTGKGVWWAEWMDTAIKETCPVRKCYQSHVLERGEMVGKVPVKARDS